MIGKVTLPNGHQIVLTDDRELGYSDPLLEDQVGPKFRTYRRTYSPAMGSFGADFLHNIAEELGGKVILERKKPSPPGTIY